MSMEITFSGGQRVDAQLGALTIVTNQDNSAPSPFALFLASIATCAGFYVLKFCQQRDLPVDDIKIVQTTHSNPDTRELERIDIDIQVPATFPEKYHAALVRSANQCAVKKALENPPALDVHASAVAEVSASTVG